MGWAQLGSDDGAFHTAPFGVPVGVDDGGDLAGFDLAATAPEDVGVFNWDAARLEVGVDGGFVLHDEVAIGAVDDTHDIDIAELGAAFAPIAVGHDGVAADLASGAFLHADGDFPMEEAVESGDANAGGGGFDVFEEGGEAADDAFFVKGFGDLTEALDGGAGFDGASGPGFGADFIEAELTFECEEDGPLLRGEVGDVGGHHSGGFIDTEAGLDGFAADVTDAEGEDAVGGHEEVGLGAGEALEHIGMLFHALTGGDFEGGPQFVIGAADFAVGGAEDNVAAEGVLFEHELEGCVEFIGGDFPGDEGTFCQFVGEEGLADAADDAAGDHGADALDDDAEGYATFFCDELEGVAEKAFHAVFADGEDAGVGFFGVVNGDFGGGGH